MGPPTLRGCACGQLGSHKMAGHAFRDNMYFWAALLLQARHGMEKYGSISSVWVERRRILNTFVMT